MAKALQPLQMSLSAGFSDSTVNALAVGLAQTPTVKRFVRQLAAKRTAAKKAKEQQQKLQQQQQQQQDANKLVTVTDSRFLLTEKQIKSLLKRLERNAKWIRRHIRRYEARGKTHHQAVIQKLEAKLKEIVDSEAEWRKELAIVKQQ